MRLGPLLPSQEAKTLYDKTLALADETDHITCWDVLADREQPLDRLGEREHQAENLRRMQSLAQEMTDSDRLAKTHLRWADFYDKTSDYAAATQAAEQALALARRIKNLYLEGQSLNRLAQTAWRHFNYPLVQTQAQAALAVLERAEALADQVTSLLLYGRASYRLGQYDTRFTPCSTSRGFGPTSG